MNKYICKLLIINCFFALGCSSDKINIDMLAGENIHELEDVKNYYREQPLKLKATEFLINNMAHKYVDSPIMDKYRAAILSQPCPMKRGYQDSVWLNAIAGDLKDSLRKRIVYDAQIITSDYLIRNIEDAFTTWEESAWFKKVDFDLFCKYILPYRVNNEPISEWRKYLKDKYIHLIADIENPEDAFILIYNKIMMEFDKGNVSCPFPLDVLMIDRYMKGQCHDRSVYLICVLRSLGIPAAYDYVPFWGNFTTSRHSWVSYIRNDSTFILTQNKKELTQYGIIDASRFYQQFNNYNVSELSYNVDSVKRVGKVFRATYEIQQERLNYIQAKDGSIPKLFTNIFLKDVSNQYGLFESRVLQTSHKGVIYLCNFVAGDNWQPIQMSKIVNGKVCFNNLNKNVVYLAARIDKSSLTSISPPFYIDEDGHVFEFIPNEEKKINVSLKRKHVLTYHWTDRWSSFLGGRFEGSNYSDFRIKDILYEITDLPTGIEYVHFKNIGKYRYIRFISRTDTRPNFAEITFYGRSSESDVEQHKIKGKLIYDGICEISLSRGMDNDYSTFFKMWNTPGVFKKNYWFGYDLGEDNRLFFTGVEFCPHSDQNMIEPGDLYELFYFKEKWITLGEKVAENNYIAFDEVPYGALLWLRNKSKGKEERIFTYEDDKQKWW